MICEAKHTSYQPTFEEFKCPRCGAQPPEGICIDDLVEGAEDTCELLHVGDYLRCYTHDCHYETSGKAFANKLIKDNHMTTCPTCKGKGVVKGKKAKTKEPSGCRV